MDGYFKSSSSSSSSHIFSQIFEENIDENIPRDLPKTPPVQPIVVDNSTNAGGNDVYTYAAESINMRSARSLTQSIILTILPGTDIIQSVVKIACDRSIYLSVVFGEGFVSEFDIGCPWSQFPSTKVLGHFRILSFSGTCDGCGAASFDNAVKTFNVSVVSARGEIKGGLVVTGMKAASLVKLVVSTP